MTRCEGDSRYLSLKISRWRRSPLHLTCLDHRLPNSVTMHVAIQILQTNGTPRQGYKVQYHPTTHLLALSREERLCQLSRATYGREWTYPLENHHEDRSDSTQRTISLRRNRGLRIGSRRAFSYSSIGITRAIQYENSLGSVGMVP